MEKDIRYKVLTTPAIQKLAEDLKDRVNNFMQHAFRNEETAKVVDFTLANTFLHSLEQSMNKLDPPKRDAKKLDQMMNPKTSQKRN